MILLITFGEIASMPFMNTIWTLRSNDKNRGQYAALFTMAWGVAQVTGPFICANIAEDFGFNVMFIFVSIILFVAAIGFYYLPTER
jgi:MFS family permease